MISMQFKKGQTPWNKGIPATPEARAKMSAHVFTEEHRRKLSESHMGGKGSYTSFAKGCVSWNKGKSLSKETRLKISVANKGRYHRPGYSPTEETRRKISCALAGENSPCWRGGASTTPYAPGFTKALKDAIRARDGFACFICGIGERGGRHVIHHIDYNKNNHVLSNLVTLCPSCHSKTNHERQVWIIYFIKGGSDGK